MNIWVKIGLGLIILHLLVGFGWLIYKLSPRKSDKKNKEDETENSIPILLESIGPARRENRERVASFFIKNRELIPVLFVYIFKTDYKLHYKAAWILEILLKKNVSILYPYIDSFTANIGMLQHESAIRPVAKICNWLAISYVKKKNKDLVNYLTIKNRKQIIETNFDWLIGNFKVATKAYCMNALFYFGCLKSPEFSWIHNELKNTILQNINDSSAAYKARGSITLKLIAKEKKRNKV